MPPSQDFLRDARSKFSTMTRSERLQASGMIGLSPLPQQKTGSPNPKHNTALQEARKVQGAGGKKTAQARAMTAGRDFGADFGGEFVTEADVGGDGEGAARAGVRDITRSPRNIEDPSEDRILIDDLSPATGWRG